MSDRIAVQQADFDIGAEIARLEGLGGGGVATFVGLIRADGDDFEALELQSYPAMAEKALATIARTAAARWPLLGVTLIHRYGRLDVGERIVLVGAASAHRAAALDACSFLIDWTKTKAPFWKREWRKDEDPKWVDAKAADEDAAAAWQEDQPTMP